MDSPHWVDQENPVLDSVSKVVEHDTCRVCGGGYLEPLFSLGEQYVSNFVDKEHITSGPKVPIELERCARCTLVQLRHTAPQDFLYSRFYWYRSGVTATMRAALQDVTKAAERAAKLEPGDVVLDIGSNDGTLLRSYSVPSLFKVGVEPATNLAEEGRKGVHEFIDDFWSYEVYREKMDRSAKVVTAIGMFYDLENPNRFIEDISLCLDRRGVFIAQLMCLHNMLSIRDVGNFAHEHLEYYSLQSLQYLFGQYGLEIFDIDTNQTNGQSYRLYAQHNGARPRPIAGRQRVANALHNEQYLHNLDTYRKFYEDMEENKDRCVRFIQQAVADGKRVWVYGASTKGNVILQYYGLDTELIEGASDRSPEKVGKYTVGTGIPIYSEEEARKTNPDYFLVLPYSFLSEFIEREANWQAGGGKFLVPLPEFRVV